MKKIALSGVMGAGKSSVIAVLKEAGIPVFDCDEINAQLLRPKEAGHAARLSAMAAGSSTQKGRSTGKRSSDHMFEAPARAAGSGSNPAPAHQTAPAGEMAHCGSEIAGGGGAAAV